MLNIMEQTVIDRAKVKIDSAREHTIREWAAHNMIGTYNIERSLTVKCMIEREGKTKEEAIEAVEKMIDEHIEIWGDTYYKNREGIVDEAFSRWTLMMLEQKGVIKILQKNVNAPDVIKVLNY